MINEGKLASDLKDEAELKEALRKAGRSFEMKIAKDIIIWFLIALAMFAWMCYQGVFKEGF